MSQRSVALLLCIVDLICVGSSVTYVCMCAEELLPYSPLDTQVAHSLVWLSLVDLSGS